MTKSEARLVAGAAVFGTATVSAVSLVKDVYDQTSELWRGADVSALAQALGNIELSGQTWELILISLGVGLLSVGVLVGSEMRKTG